MNKAPLLIAKNIGKTFYHPREVIVLKDINLEVENEIAIAITGRSGSGKSTLLHILGTLETPSQGSLTLFGEPLTKSNISFLRSHKIGFIFQASNLLEEYTLLENLLIKARIARKPTGVKSLAYQEALSLLDHVDLSHRKDFPVKFLSGGEKQRGAIARALMNNPDLILADEPTGNLDQTSAIQIQKLLLNACKELKKSLIIVTHDLNFAKECDQTYSLNSGVSEEISFQRSSL